jgi:hypothetical protein
MTMNKVIYALFPLVILGCGQGALESESTSAVGSQQDDLEAHRRIEPQPDEAARASAALSGPAAAGAKPQFRCETDQLPRAETLLAAAPIRKPDAKFRAPSPPLRPEVIEAPPARSLIEEQGVTEESDSE